VATARLPPSYIPLTVGPGSRYRPPLAPIPPIPPISGSSASGRPVPGTPATGAAESGCDRTLGRRFGVHVELFANRHVVLIPAGIGVAAPVVTRGVVTGGRCYQRLVTLDPTGVVRIAAPASPSPAGTPVTLGDLFALWGQPLDPTRLASFTGHRVEAFVDGHPVGNPAAIRLRRHDEVVLETAGHVVPHRSYRFPGGL
jgi:hypothetical protein